jgi:hypothetical protein
MKPVPRWSAPVEDSDELIETRCRAHDFVSRFLARSLAGTGDDIARHALPHTHTRTPAHLERLAAPSQRVAR